MVHVGSLNKSHRGRILGNLEGKDFFGHIFSFVL